MALLRGGMIWAEWTTAAQIWHCCLVTKGVVHPKIKKIIFVILMFFIILSNQSDIKNVRHFTAILLYSSS